MTKVFEVIYYLDSAVHVAEACVESTVRSKRGGYLLLFLSSIMKYTRPHMSSMAKVLCIFVTVFQCNQALAQDAKSDPSYFNDRERMSAVYELSRLLGINYRNEFDSRDRIVVALRHCGLGDEALKHQVKNLQDVLDRLAEKRLDEDRKSNRPQFESLKAEDKVFAMLMAALEMQGVRKGVEIALRHWHPSLKQDDVLCKQVLEEAFQLPVIDETPGVPKATR